MVGAHAYHILVAGYAATRLCVDTYGTEWGVGLRLCCKPEAEVWLATWAVVLCALAFACAILRDVMTLPLQPILGGAR